MVGSLAGVYWLKACLLGMYPQKNSENHLKNVVYEEKLLTCLQNSVLHATAFISVFKMMINILDMKGQRLSTCNEFMTAGTDGITNKSVTENHINRHLKHITSMLIDLFYIWNLESFVRRKMV